MRLEEETPASKAMEFYRETLESKGCRGTPRKTLVTTISNNIKRVLEVNPTFPLKTNKTTTDLQHARTGYTGYTGKEQLLEPFTVLLNLKNHYNSAFEATHLKEEEEEVFY